jgi:hypothetical protein
MLIANSKANIWGCVACYNHLRKDVESFCKVAHDKVIHLSTCPIGSESFAVEKAIHISRKFAKAKSY